MNFKKIITGVVVGAMAVSAMAVSAFAEDTKTNFDVRIYISGMGHGDAVNISKDGEFSVKAEDLNLNPNDVWGIYIKDVYAEETPAEEKVEGYKTPLAPDFAVESFKVKINGNDVTDREDDFINEKAKNRDDNKDSYIFDYCFYMNAPWGNFTFINFPDETINSIEVIMKIKSGNPAEPEVSDSEATESQATEPEVSNSEATEPEVSDSNATEPEASDSNATEPEVSGTEGTADVTSGVAGSTNGGNDDKGNQPTGIVFAVIPAVAAAAAVVVSKKRK